MKKKVITGLESLMKNPPGYLSGKRIGLLANPASVNSAYQHALPLLHSIFGKQLKALFSPQHGFYAEKQDNMIESGHFVEPRYQIPVFSLYSTTRIPTREMFDSIDTLIVDIQDVGTRVYTFIYTVSYCLETAAKLDKQVIVLDRPNPVGGDLIEGNLLCEACRSFVGRYPIPMRHGMTIGEICRYFNEEYGIHADLKVIPMQYWHRHMLWEDTGLPWILPSPNLPTPQSARVYPGQVIFEGTNISEGRGTTLPFEQCGAPFIDADTLGSALEGKIKGAVLRPVSFEPTSGKWAGKVCKGFQIHVTDELQYRPYYSSLLLLQQMIRLFPDDFKFKLPPYEYEYQRQPIDLILGSRELRKKIVNQEDLDQIEAQWQPDLLKFKNISKGYYLYE